MPHLHISMAAQRSSRPRMYARTITTARLVFWRWHALTTLLLFADLLLTRCAQMDTLAAAFAATSAVGIHVRTLVPVAPLLHRSVPEEVLAVVRASMGLQLFRDAHGVRHAQSGYGRHNPVVALAYLATAPADCAALHSVCWTACDRGPLGADNGVGACRLRPHAPSHVRARLAFRAHLTTRWRRAGRAPALVALRAALSSTTTHSWGLRPGRFSCFTGSRPAWTTLCSLGDEPYGDVGEGGFAVHRARACARSSSKPCTMSPCTCSLPFKPLARET
jgi:hypothetical protein